MGDAAVVMEGGQRCGRAASKGLTTTNLFCAGVPVECRGVVFACKAHLPER
jgi:hypothetical protein